MTLVNKFDTGMGFINLFVDTYEDGSTECTGCNRGGVRKFNVFANIIHGP